MAEHRPRMEDFARGGIWTVFKEPLLRVPPSDHARGTTFHPIRLQGDTSRYVIAVASAHII